MYCHPCRSCLYLAAAAIMTFSASFAGAQQVSNAFDTAQRVIQLRSEGEELLESIPEMASEVLTENSLLTQPGPVVSFEAIDTPPAPTPVRQALVSPIIKPTAAWANQNVTLEEPPAPRVAQNPTITPQVQLQPRQIPAQQISWAGHTLSPSPIAAAPIRSLKSSPAILTEITAPEYVNVGELAKVTINVRNPGQSTIHDIQLRAIVPADAQPNPVGGILEDDQCSFEISSLQPGEQRKLTIEMTPSEKEALDIATQITIADRKRIQVGVRKPNLELSVQGPSQANIGAATTHTVTIANTGDGVARNVRLEADFPDQLKFIRQAGMNAPKTLIPGQKMKVQVTSMPQTPGITGLTFLATGTAIESDPKNTSIRVTQPELRVAAVGPDMNFVHRDGIYTISIENAGEVDVNNVSIRFDIPKGFKITTINRPAKMDARANALTWRFDKIESQSQRNIQLKAIATSEGEKTCNIVIDSNETAEKALALKTIIATRADLSIRMKNIGGPVQVGSETEFVVIVENRGSNMASDMEIQIQLPEGLRPNQPEEGIIDEASNSILFSDSNLSPGKTREFRFSAIGIEKGEQIVRSSLQSVGSEQRIISENSIFVYEPTQARVSESLSPQVPR